MPKEDVQDTDGFVVEDETTDEPEVVAKNEEGKKKKQPENNSQDKGKKDSQNEKLDIASDIVEKLMISKSHISFSVESLKNKGYIEKVLDTQNKKKLHLKLTNKAEKIVNLLDNEQNKLKDTLLQNIDEQEKKQFKDTFEKILKNAKNMAK